MLKCNRFFQLLCTQDWVINVRIYRWEDLQIILKRRSIYMCLQVSSCCVSRWFSYQFHMKYTGQTRWDDYFFRTYVYTGSHKWCHNKHCRGFTFVRFTNRWYFTYLTRYSIFSYDVPLLSLFDIDVQRPP